LHILLTLPKKIPEDWRQLLTYGDVRESSPKTFNYPVVGRDIWSRGNREDPVWGEKFVTYLLIVEFKDGAEVRTGCSEWNDVLLYP